MYIFKRFIKKQIVDIMSDRELSCSNTAGQFMDRGRMNQNGVVQPLLTGKCYNKNIIAFFKIFTIL